jgi:hypothetical protein
MRRRGINRKSSPDHDQSRKECIESMERAGNLVEVGALKRPVQKPILALAAALLAVVVLSIPAGAHSGQAKYYYRGGDVLVANVWIQSFSDWSGCGSWQTSAQLWGWWPPYAVWINNQASFYAYGIGASLSAGAGGVSGSSGGNSASFSWTNDNNWISDLAGTVCGNIFTWYISAGSTAVSYVPQYGSPRSAVVWV